MKVPSGKISRHHAHLFRRLSWDELDVAYLRHLVELARAEDIEGSGLSATPGNPCDVTTEAIPEDLPGHARLVARKPMCLAALGIVTIVQDIYGGNTGWHPFKNDGDTAMPGDTIGEVSGHVRELLQAERVLLNFLQHLCGVATQTARYVEAMGWSPTKLIDTRKTTPGYRMLEKYAVACGGGWNHRLGLFDRVMLKDNHLAASNAVTGERLCAAVREAKRLHPHITIEVEVDTLTQIPPVLDAGADVILLDNFSVPELAEAVSLIGNRAFTEASGGVTLEGLPELSSLGLDFISCGSLIHQSTWVDIGLDWS